MQSGHLPKNFPVTFTFPGNSSEGEKVWQAPYLETGRSQTCSLCGKATVPQS